jgi:hypothetical protein
VSPEIPVTLKACRNTLLGSDTLLKLTPSKFTLHILSDIPEVFQRLKYILLMDYQILGSYGQPILDLTTARVCYDSHAVYSIDDPDKERTVASKTA